MIAAYMIPVYAFLLKAEKRTVDSLPASYQVPVAEYLAKELEEKLGGDGE